MAASAVRAPTTRTEHIREFARMARANYLALDELELAWLGMLEEALLDIDHLEFELSFIKKAGQKKIAI